MSNDQSFHTVEQTDAGTISGMRARRSVSKFGSAPKNFSFESSPLVPGKIPLRRGVFVRYWYQNKQKWPRISEAVFQRSKNLSCQEMLQPIWFFCQTVTYLHPNPTSGLLISEGLYFGITGKGLWLQRVGEGTKKIWRKWLNRRGGKSSMPWEKFQKLT